MEFTFETLKFLTPESEEADLKGRFLRIYELQLPRKKLDKLGVWKIEKGTLIFEQEVNERSFYKLLDHAMLDLTNIITNKPTTYIHEASGIPLIGSIEFGILDRGSNIIEVRPISGCNIRCIYCSVNDDARVREVVVDRVYLANELKKLIAYKTETRQDKPNKPDIDVHIGTQGEPTLYADLINLLKDIRAIPEVRDIEMVTNGVLFTKKYIDQLAEAGLTRVNLSLNAIDPEKAHEIAGIRTPAKKILQLCPYVAEKMDLVIAPVYVQGVNDDQLDKLVEFTKSLKTQHYKPKIFIQNFLRYKHGRNPTKELPFDKFYKKLEALQAKHEITLICTPETFDIHPTPTYKKPFKKGQVVEAEIKAPGRLPGELICVKDDRVISVMNCKEKRKGLLRLKIIRAKHNIFYGVPA